MLFVFCLSPGWAEDEVAINEQFQQAYNQYHAGAITEANQNLRAFVQSHPESRQAPTAYFILGKIQFQNLDNGEAALQDFKMVVDPLPGFLSCRRRLLLHWLHQSIRSSGPRGGAGGLPSRILSLSRWGFCSFSRRQDPRDYRLVAAPRSRNTSR